MNRNSKIVVLVIIAIILGYAVYNQQQNKLPSSSTSLTTPPIPLTSNLTEEEKFILNPPSATASSDLKKKHADTIAKLAKEGSSLEIKDCKPNILVLQVKQGSDLVAKNLDSVKHRLIFDSEHIFELPASGSKTINVDFKYGTGDYGFVCEGIGLTGFLHIIP